MAEAGGSRGEALHPEPPSFHLTRMLVCFILGVVKNRVA
nr:MAG TPA: hypothetical protein [Caudoviricetes sp.]